MASLSLQANSLAELGEHIRKGMACQFGFDSSCGDVVLRAVLFIFFYTTGNLIALLLVKYAEGAIYMVVVRALVTPLGSLFWTVFQAEPFFAWHPTFTITTGFILGGLAVMMPAVVMYSIFSVQDQKEEYLRLLRQEQQIN